MKTRLAIFAFYNFRAPLFKSTFVNINIKHYYLLCMAGSQKSGSITCQAVFKRTHCFLSTNCLWLYYIVLKLKETFSYRV